MKYLKTKNTYKASNVELNMNTLTAKSYNWWTFLAVIDGKLVFNNHAYSNSTQRHQSKVYKILLQKGIKIDLFIDSSQSLSASNLFPEAIGRLEFKIYTFKTAMAQKGTKKAKNEERANSIKNLEAKIDEINLFIHKSPVMAQLNA